MSQLRAWHSLIQTALLKSTYQTEHISSESLLRFCTQLRKEIADYLAKGGKLVIQGVGTFEMVEVEKPGFRAAIRAMARHEDVPKTKQIKFVANSKLTETLNRKA